MRVLLILPPMMQMNSPYPSTAYLKRYLSGRGHEIDNFDLGLELFLQLFSQQGLRLLHEGLNETDHDSVLFFREAFSDYTETIDPVVRFLQGKDSSLALRIVTRRFLPEGPRFVSLDENPGLLDEYGTMGLQDKAKYLSSLYLDDLADTIKWGLDESFEFSRYGESLASSMESFDPLLKILRSPPSLIDQMMFKLLEGRISDFKPEVVGFSLPFPGNVLASLRSASFIKERFPSIKIIAGGGYVNTELRGLSDPRFFDFVDYLTYDDGEKPLECLLEHFEGKRNEADLLRTRLRKNGQVIWNSTPKEADVNFKNIGAPDFRGLPLGQYVSMVEMPNPMHRMWSDFRWNKMILAHGCYWKKCTFCDVNLDYIGRFEPASANQVIENIETVIKETGQTGFHFVDEAAPPALLRQISNEIQRRKIKITWWGNLRFDKQFSSELTDLMADAGCVAVTGGLEVASPRVLKLINKGVEIEQVARVTKSFKDSGIFVHAYLMYGYPTQTDQETVDSLEVVRQLFANECLDSAHWHRFLATVHSPVGRNPDTYKIQLNPPPVPENGLFSEYAVPFTDLTGADPDKWAFGLRKALYNYMHGIGLEDDVRVWFDFAAPKSSLSKTFIQKALATDLISP